jgi:transcription antitermination protein NusB
LKKDRRRRAREAALQILYQWDISRGDIARSIETYFDLQWPDDNPAPDEIRIFASALARETVEALPVIDPLIADTAERWRPERMPVLDRLILRMAICELMRHPVAPPAVIINEALELARTFSTEESVKFINGMLDGARKKIDGLKAQDSGPEANPKP